MTHHSSPSWVSYGVSIVSILGNTDQDIMALHCIMFLEYTHFGAYIKWYIYGLVQNCSNSSALAKEML